MEGSVSVLPSLDERHVEVVVGNDWGDRRHIVDVSCVVFEVVEQVLDVDVAAE